MALKKGKKRKKKERKKKQRPGKENKIRIKNDNVNYKE
jgi:hypothetical protein